MNIFEQATRNKIRFPSDVGTLNLEQLWDLNLTVRGGADLDKVAQKINEELKTVTESSFVATTNTAKAKTKAELTLKLDIVKHIIDVKIAEADEAKAKKTNAERRRVLLDALANKKTETVAAMSEEDLLKELALLS